MEIDNLKANYSLLAAKVTEMATLVNPNQVCMNTISFDSEADVAVWCSNHLPSGKFGCFLDPLAAYQMVAVTVMPTLVNTMMTLAFVEKLGLAGVREALMLTPW
jgi:hypothetical protein